MRLTPRQRAYLEQPGLTQPERFGIQVRLRTPEGLDVAALIAALRSLPEAHEALRLRFRQHEGRWLQFLGVGPSPELLDTVDIARVIPGQLLVQSEELDRKLIGGVDLEHGPLLRALFLDRGPAETGILTIFFHHLVTDAISVAILLGDLTRSYEGHLQKTPLTPPSHAPGFAAWCHAHSREATVTEERDRGTEQSELRWLDPALEEERKASPLRDTPRPAGSLDPETDARLSKRFPQSRDVEAVLLAAFAWVFNRRIKRPLRVEIQTHGRWPRNGIDPRFSVGWFASLHTLEFSMSSDACETDSLVAARAALRSLHEAPDRAGVAGARPRATMEYRTIIEDTFRPGALFPILDVVWWNPPRTTDPFEMDLSLLSGHSRGRLWWRLSANPSIYASSTVVAMAADIKAYLERASQGGSPLVAVD